MTFRGDPGRDAPKREVPKRVRVTSPRRAAVRRVAARPVAREIEEETALGELYLDSLIQAQARLARIVLAGIVVVIASLPILFLVVPGVHDLRVGPVPLPWLVLGGLIYPLALVVARAYVRAAERVERDFTDLVKRP